MVDSLQCGKRGSKPLRGCRTLLGTHQIEESVTDALVSVALSHVYAVRRGQFWWKTRLQAICGTQTVAGWQSGLDSLAFDVAFANSLVATFDAFDCAVSTRFWWKMGRPMHITRKLKLIDAALHRKAVAKADLEGNDYVQTLLLAMNPGKLSESDRATLNDFLGFGEGVMCTVDKGVVSFGKR